MKSRRIKTGLLNKKTLHFSNSRRLGNKDLHSIVLACTGTFKVEMTLEQTFGLIKTDTIAENFTDKLAAALAERKYNFVCLNFANGDMVGHTGVYEAIIKAVHAVDDCVKTVVQAAKTAGYEVVIIADHGNADNAVNADGSPNTAHSLNPVPIVVVSDRVASVQNGVLADVAPTVLSLMGVEPPAAMTGKSLIEFKA